jgi:hypothetical protein
VPERGRDLIERFLPPDSDALSTWVKVGARRQAQLISYVDKAFTSRGKSKRAREVVDTLAWGLETVVAFLAPIREVRSTPSSRGMMG